MRIGRTLPPAAAPFSLKEVLSGLAALFTGESARERFQAELREYYRVPHVFLLSSGKAALAVILQALKELAPERDEVLVPAYTCYSVPAAVTRAGLRVRSCDIDPRTLDFDWGQVEEALAGGEVLAAVSTHLFGLPADVERLKGLAARHGVAVIEDAAQAMGGELDGRKLGTLGDVALFSLGRGKPLSTVSGGIILTGNGKLAEAISALVKKLPGEGWSDGVLAFCYALALLILLRPCFFWLPRALSFLKLGETVFDPSFDLKRLGSFQAGVAKGWQERLVRLREARLDRAGLLEKAGFAAPPTLKGARPNLIRFPVLVEDAVTRQRLLKESEEQGLGLSAVYPEAVSGIPELKGRAAGGPAPRAEQVARSLVTLPVHPYVTKRDVELIAGLFRDAST